MTTSNEGRPGWETEATEVHGQANGFSLAAGDRLAQYLDGVYVVVVQVGDDRLRRRVYLNLPSAQRAAERAQDRGHEAQVVLCQLQPVGVIE